MRLLEKTKLKKLLFTLVMLVALPMCLAFIMPGAGTTAEALDDDVIYRDTDVKNILVKFMTGTKALFLGFEMTESDYAGQGQIEGAYSNSAEDDFYEYSDRMAIYDKYITTDLTYWKNFENMNSRGLVFKQIWIYWNGSSLSGLENTFAQHVYLKKGNFKEALDSFGIGFVVAIPKGTTFPSLDYVFGGCQGAPIMYRTTEDRAFYYDGNAFVSMPYDVAVYRNEVKTEIGNTDLSNYYEKEQVDVESLVGTYQDKVEQCFSKLSIDETVGEFEEALSKIMTKANYLELEDRKSQAISEMNLFFDGFSEADYDEVCWNKLLSFKDEFGLILGGVNSVEEIGLVVKAVKYSANKILDKGEQEDFSAFKAEKASLLDGVEEETIYRENERDLRNALIEEGKCRIESAESYGEVEAVLASYSSQIRKLKTKEELEEEEKNNSEMEMGSSESHESVLESEGGREDKKANWIWIVVGAVVLLGLSALTIVLIKNKKVKNKSGETRNEE